MKKLILFASSIFLSVGVASAQAGYSPTGLWDDFETSTQYSLGTGEGMYWFDLTEGDTLALSRPGTGALNVTATNAGGCVGKDDCYPVFGVEFGNDNGNAYTIDLTTTGAGSANIILDVENMTTDQLMFMDIKLVDINNVQSEYEPNVSDVVSTTTWAEASKRKSLNGFTLDFEERKTITIDLSSVNGAIGGLSQNGAHDCAPGPFNCPPTSYQIDATRIKSILFRVNFGNANIFLSEGDGDYTADTFIEGPDILPFTGVFKIHDFKIGTMTESTTDAAVANSLSVYPNPADDALAVKFETTTEASVTMSDVLGNNVYSTTTGVGANKFDVNTSEFATGMYILNISTENGTVSRKVAIK